MKSKDIVIVGILLGIGAIVRLFSLVVPGPITSNLVIAFYALAILLIVPKVREAIGIGLVAGIICALISHAYFPPANLISEPVGAVVAILTIRAIDQIKGSKERKDNPIGMVVAALGLLMMLAFAILMAVDPTNAFGISALTVTNNKIIFGLASLILTFVGLFFIPNMLVKFKAAITALLATIASGLVFTAISAFVIFELPSILFKSNAPPVDIFIMTSLPIVVGCAIINMIIAQVLYYPAKQAMR